MSFVEYIDGGGLLITEGSIYEKLRRFPSVSLDPFIANASLIYDSESSQILKKVLEDYLLVGQDFNLPMLTLTNTWRANPERIEQSEYSLKKVNTDCVEYYQHVLSGLPGETPVYLGGLTGCRGDAYKAEEALGEEEAYSFHLSQVTELAQAGVDFLFASTLPAKSEAKGIARAMSETGTPYIISFVLRGDGSLLDGTSLTSAIEEIDSQTAIRPFRYMINCSHSSTFRAAYPHFSSVADRVAGLQANTSSRDPLELDGSEELQTEEPRQFGFAMRKLRDDFQIQVLGGCCGTDTEHIRELAQQLSDLTNG